MNITVPILTLKSAMPEIHCHVAWHSGGLLCPAPWTLSSSKTFAFCKAAALPQLFGLQEQQMLLKGQVGHPEVLYHCGLSLLQMVYDSSVFLFKHGVLFCVADPRLSLHNVNVFLLTKGGFFN